MEVWSDSSSGATVRKTSSPLVSHQQHGARCKCCQCAVLLQQWLPLLLMYIMLGVGSVCLQGAGLPCSSAGTITCRGKHSSGKVASHCEGAVTTASQDVLQS